MARGKPSGINLYRHDARVIIGMSLRGDREHDIAAWFGVNQGRIAEAKAGEYGTTEAAPEKDLPPSGPPGVKGRRLRDVVGKAIDVLEAGDSDAAIKILSEAAAKFDANED